MAKKDIRFTLDTIDSKYSPVGTVKQLDSVFFYIKITENGVTKDLTGQTIKLFAIKEDKKIVEQTTKINITNETEGLVEIELLNSAIQVHGFTYFELEISDNTGIISTSDFILRVDRRVGSDEAIESTNEVATLKEIEIYVAQAKEELQRFKELQTEMLRTNETINSNEEGRVNAEKKRVLAEEERGTLFAQKEVERNNTFTQGERERNETFEEAENNRAVAESERVIAEQERKEKFAGFENKINVNTEELEGARTATTGEEFATLDERIDCEVDRLNKKIEVSMLQQEDKESHVVENSVDGMTTDMVIKGRTLQNLFNQEGYYINPNGSQQYFHSRKYKNLFKAGKYTLKNITGNALIWDISRKDNDEWVKSIKSNKSIAIELEEGQYVRNIQALTINGWVLDESTRKILENNVVVLEGDKLDIIDSINYFEGIKSFGQQEDKISILSRGINLCDVNSHEASVALVNDNFNQLNTVVKLNIEVDPKKTYVISYTSDTTGYRNIKLLGCNTTIPQCSTHSFAYNFATKNGGRESSDTITGYKYLTITTGGAFQNTIAPVGSKIGINNIQLEEGTVATSYEPYQSNKKDILLSELGFDEGLKGFDLISCDKLNSKLKKVIKMIEKYIFTGNENFSLIASDSEGDYISFLYTGLNNRKYQTKLISNNFVKLSSSQENKEGIYCYSSNFNISIRVLKSKLNTQDAEGFKAWLKANQTTIYYELAEPVETPLDENISLKVYNEKTYVSFENSISCTSSFKAPVDTTATIARLNRENRALEEENKTLRQDFESTTLVLTDSDLKLVKQNVDMDFRLMEVEFALDIPQAILSSNIKFKNKKGEVKSMARTPYEMMKIVILSGDYDREDYMYKVGKYYERGRMTKEEHDELMSLMTADEVISK